jgi:hypothetical protein
MLPYSQDLPAIEAQCPVGQTVSRLVPPNLRSPIRFVATWQAVVFWATVPKTTINEYNKISLRECEIRPSSQGQMPPPSFDFVLPEDRRKGTFRFLVILRPDSRHYFRALLLAENVNHVCSVLLNYSKDNKLFFRLGTFQNSIITLLA